jgi:voltage-gated potassium channel
LSAKALNPSLKIICRANALSSVAKLKNAGATSISMPDVLGGVHMATQVSKPDVIEFIEYLTGEEGDSINIESVDYNKLPPEIRNTSLRNIMDWKKTGVTCIGIKDEQGKFLINPDYNIVIKENMKVIVLGNNEQINDMKHNVDE